MNAFFRQFRALAWRAGFVLPTRAEWESTMSALDDLTAAEANEETVLNALLSDIDTLKGELANVKPDDTDAIEAIVAKMTTAQKAASDKLNPPTDTVSGGQASA